MKKTYKNPLFTVVEIQPEEFIALSTLGETDATSGNLGREFEFTDWGDEVNYSDWDEEKLSF